MGTESFNPVLDAWAEPTVAHCRLLLDWCNKSEAGMRLTFLVQLMLDALKLVASDLRLLLQRSLGFMGFRVSGTLLEE